MLRALKYIPRMGKPQARPVIWLALLLASSARVFALDPSLDVSQYAHTAWKVREGFTKGSDLFDCADPGWLSVAGHGIRVGPLRWCPGHPVAAPRGRATPRNLVTILWSRATALFGLAQKRGSPVGRTASLRNIQRLLGSRIYSLLQDAEGTIWFGVRDPGRLCAVRAGKMQCYGAGSFGWAVTALYKDHKGNLWVSSAETGLWRWAPGHPEPIPVARGRSGHALLEDDNGALLMATSKAGRLEGSVNGLIKGLKHLVDGNFQDYTLPATMGSSGPLPVPVQ